MFRKSNNVERKDNREKDNKEVKFGEVYELKNNLSLLIIGKIRGSNNYYCFPVASVTEYSDVSNEDIELYINGKNLIVITEGLVVPFGDLENASFVGELNEKYSELVKKKFMEYYDNYFESSILEFNPEWLNPYRVENLQKYEKYFINYENIYYV